MIVLIQTAEAPLTCLEPLYYYGWKWEKAFKLFSFCSLVQALAAPPASLLAHTFLQLHDGEVLVWQKKKSNIFSSGDFLELNSP